LLAETATKGVSRLFVADIPLLFEGGIDFGQSVNLLVATSRETQICRLKNYAFCVFTNRSSSSPHNSSNRYWFFFIGNYQIIAI